jgi:hypothetical protein
LEVISPSCIKPPVNPLPLSFLLHQLQPCTLIKVDHSFCKPLSQVSTLFNFLPFLTTCQLHLSYTFCFLIFSELHIDRYEVPAASNRQISKTPTEFRNLFPYSATMLSYAQVVANPPPVTTTRNPETSLTVSNLSMADLSTVSLSRIDHTIPM